MLPLPLEPGDTVLPLFSANVPATVPLPPKVAPEPTDTALPDAKVPFKKSVEVPLTVVAPVYVLVPDNVNVPLPDSVSAVFAPELPSLIGRLKDVVAD